MKIEITKIAQTKKLANDIAKKLKGGEVLALSGDLGAGKTTFTQYLAKALGVKGNVNSPTFVLMKIYETKKKPIRHLVHLDVYRLNSGDDLITLGLDEYLGKGDSVVVIEWAEKIEKELKSEIVKKLSFIQTGGKRFVKIK